MKLMKRLLAISLGAALLMPITAYADQTSDAAALYNQVEAKLKNTTDMNAYYDLHMKMDMDGTKGGPGVGDTQAGPGETVGPIDIRMEMNAKMNHMTDPENMHYMAYSRMTFPGGTQITGTQYYLNGYSYMDMMGQKVKYAMPMADIMKQIESSTSTFEMPTDYIKDLTLSTDQDGNRVLSFTTDDSKMNSYVQNILGSTELGTMTGGATMNLHNMSCQYVVNSNDDIIKMRINMDMDLTVEGQTVNVSVNGDVGIADPGQPVDVPTPDVSQFKEVSMPMS